MFISPWPRCAALAPALMVALGCGRSDVYGGGGVTSGSNSTATTGAGSSATSGSGRTTGPASASGGTGSSISGGMTTGSGTTSAGSTTSATASAGTSSSGTTGSARCQRLGDCLALTDTCQAGTCRANLCGPQPGGGSPNGQLDGACAAADAGDGACVPTEIGGVNNGLCSQGGTAQASCDPAATRAELGRACGSQQYCLASVGGGGSCFQLCDPFSMGNTCGKMSHCAAPLPANPRLGLCEPGGKGTTGGTGGADSGCSATVAPSEFQSCQKAGDCGCPMQCAKEPAAGGTVCEYPCSQLSDCPNLATICGSAGVCTVVECGGATGNGSFDSLCNVVDAGDGTCLPLTPDGGSSVGYCVQGGNTASNCNPIANRTNQVQACPAGQICFGGTVNFGGTCNELCNPSGGGVCPGTQFCSGIVNEPDLGVCL